MENDKKKIIDTINYIKPFLSADGGSIEFVDFKSNIVYVKLLGTCSQCSMADEEIINLIESALKEAVPSVSKVINLT